MNLKPDLNSPRFLSLQTTSTCNASCVFCPYEDIKGVFPPTIMDMSLYKKIIDERSRCKHIERIILYMNNEPLTDPHIIERINYAKEKVPWANVHLLTNGLLLTPEMSDRLLDSSLDWIGISFHGIRKETIEKAMGIPHETALERITAFIEKAKNKKNIKDYLMLTFLRHKYLSYKEKEETIDFWKNKGIERISYFDGPVSRAGNVKGLAKAGHKENIAGCNSIWADEMLHVVEDGKVVLCCMDWRREVILGDLNKQTIDEIWNGRRRDVWQMIEGDTELPKDFLCRRCEEAKSENKDAGQAGVVKTESEKILLAICPSWGLDNPPLGLASIAAYLEGKDVGVEVLDLNIDIYHRVADPVKELWKMDKAHLWWSPSLFQSKIKPYLEKEIEWAASEILKRNIDNIGFSVYGPNRCFTAEVAKEIKRRRPSVRIIVGGRGIYDVLERYNFPEGVVDFFIVGEAEETLYQLLKGNKDFPGIIEKREDTVIPCFLESLEGLPLIDYKKFDLDKYKEKSIALLMNRGCIFKCAFCNDWRYIGKLRSRKAEEIYREIEYHFYKNSVRKFYFSDQAINANLKELNRLCDLLIDASFRIEWIALAIPWKFLSQALLHKMRRAGCITLNYGVEAGSNNVLALMGKQFTIEEAEVVLADTRKAQINTQINFVIGFPGEREEDFQATRGFLRRNLKSICGITNLNICYATLGSDLVINREKYGLDFTYDFPEQLDSHWFTKSKDNTYDIRLRRARELLEDVKAYNIPIFTSNVAGRVKEKGLDHRDPLKREHNILLVVCPMWGVEIPPMGVSYLASYLEYKGMPVDIMDINIEMYAKSDARRKQFWKMENYNLWAWEDLFEKLLSNFDDQLRFYVDEISAKGYKIIGFSLHGANALFSIKMAQMLKERNPDIFIIFGGTSCAFLHDDPVMPVRNMVSFKTKKNLVEPGVVDAFVVGEGEEALFNLISAYLKDNRVASLPGVIVFSDGRYSEPLPPKLISDIDQIPCPAWEKFSLGSYSTLNTLPLLFSRGCINQCAFCNDFKIWQKRFRCRSAANIFNEIRYIVNRFGIRSFVCNDLLFNGDLKMLDQLSGLLIGSDLDIKWSAQGVTRGDMDDRLLKKLKKSGLRWITYGVESLSDKVIAKMNKRYTFKEIKQVLKETKKAGIGVSVNFIVGFPTETEEDFLITKQRLTQLKPYIDEVSSLNECSINGEIDLEISPEKYSITVSKERPFDHWQAQEGKNNYQIRQVRRRQLRQHAEKLGITVRFADVYHDEEDLNKEMGITEVVEKKEASRKKDFVLVNLPPWAQENPHIGVGYISAYLRSKAVSFEVLDLNKSFFLAKPDYKMLWHVENKNFWSNQDTFTLITGVFSKEIDKGVEEIANLRPQLIGFSVVDPKERLTLEFIKRIKQRMPQAKIVLGGPATSTEEQRRIFLDNANDLIDAFVVGEGEESCFNLIQAVGHNKRPQNISGTLIRNNGSWETTLPRPVEPLEKVPFPTYKEFDMSLYGKSLLVEWSRGCFSRCSFCKNWRLFPHYRAKDPEWVIDELKHHVQAYGIREFTVVDSVLNGDLKKLAQICDLIIENDLKITWSGQIAPRKDMDLAFFRHMKKAGCTKLQIGVESASDQVLQNMKKTYTAEISEQAVRNAKNAQIETEIFIIIGFPGETEKEFKKTYDFIERNKDHIDTIKSINTLHLIAGTEVYENGKEKFNFKPLPKENWHYLWETRDGNTYEARKARAGKLLDLASRLGIKVMETNIQEGKENAFKALEHRQDSHDRLALLKESINSLHALPQEHEVMAFVRKKRPLTKIVLLVFIVFYAFFYICYFWIYMLVFNKVLLGGRKK